MVQYITWLRALAACLITNSHYTGIYPTDLIANGGLIGDVIFFAVSGYCLFNIKLSFKNWYSKRFCRIYVPIWIGTGIILLAGGYDFSDRSIIEWFIYPTAYHFVASIMLLYIPFYFVAKARPTKKQIVRLMCGIAVVMIVAYLLVYDFSYYHVDNVREPYIEFIYFESMLLGAYFKIKEYECRNRFSFTMIFMLICSFCIYFYSKLYFSSEDAIYELQIINQFLLFALLYYIMFLFSALELQLKNLPSQVNSIVEFIASMTLEIYIVQYALIELLRDVGSFPFNWIVVTLSIILGALCLKIVSDYILNLNKKSLSSHDVK